MNRRGDAGEALAAAYLERRGLRILSRNYRCRFGEIDLVAESGSTLVFVEVRARRSDDFGGPGESITAAKRRRLVAAARHYLAATGERPARFDVVLIRGEPGTGRGLVARYLHLFAGAAPGALAHVACHGGLSAAAIHAQLAETLASGWAEIGRAHV